MNELTNDNSPESMSAFLPLTILGASLALVLIFQITVLLPQRDSLQKMSELLQKTSIQNEQGVKQSAAIQSGFQALVVDLNAVAPEETKAAFAKYGLTVSGLAPATPSASSTPSASPSASPAAQ